MVGESQGNLGNISGTDRNRKNEIENENGEKGKIEMDEKKRENNTHNLSRPNLAAMERKEVVWESEIEVGKWRFLTDCGVSAFLVVLIDTWGLHMFCL